MKLNKKLLTELIIQCLNEQTYKVYHGTNNKFDKFDYDRIESSNWHGYGFYFSDNKSEASLYGNNIINANITLNNPIDLTKLKDTSVQGSGIVRLFTSIKGLDSLKHDDKTYKEINTILDKLEKEVNSKDIYFSEGSNKNFQHAWIDYNDKEYVIRDITKNEQNDKEYLKNLMIKQILYKKYNISGLPIRIKETGSTYEFSKIAKQNGYDGVITHNSNLPTGNEYVVFDIDSIKIIK